MSTLGELPPAAKKVNFVWIGDNTINYLGAFNILTWLACGWSVAIYTHQPKKDADPFPQDIYELFCQHPKTLVEHPLLQVASIESEAVMPYTGAVLSKWIRAMGQGYTQYAIGDLAKSFIAGTRSGIVLDLKIGPSRWIHEYPAAPFNKFVSFSRAGAISVENQCLGSFNLEASNAYGKAFDASARSETYAFAKREFKSKNAAEATFGSITGLHAKKFNELVRKNSAVDLKTYEAKKWEFLELVQTFDSKDAARNSGPFRVYQSPGYFNWKQGEYEEERRANNLAVAATLRAEHGGKLGTFVMFADLDRDGYYSDVLRPLALKAAAALEKG